MTSLFLLQLSNEDERQRAIKQCLDRNPNAFKVSFLRSQYCLVSICLSLPYS